MAPRADDAMRARMAGDCDDGTPDSVAFDVGGATAPWQGALATG